MWPSFRPASLTILSLVLIGSFLRCQALHAQGSTVQTQPDQEKKAAKPKVTLEQLKATVEANPEDIKLRLSYAQALFKIGNLNETWAQLRIGYKQAPKDRGIRMGSLMLLDAIEKKGMFQVGVPSESILEFLGEPDQKVDLGKRIRWVYSTLGLDFENDQIHHVVNLAGATEELFIPDETVQIELDGRGWEVGRRRLGRGRTTAVLFLPGESMTDWTEQFEMNRILNAASAGTMDEIADMAAKEGGTKDKPLEFDRLETSDDSMIVATETLDPDPTLKQFQLIRYIKGKEDLHRIALTIRAKEQPSREKFTQWFTILKKAELKEAKK